MVAVGALFGTCRGDEQHDEDDSAYAVIHYADGRGMRRETRPRSSTSSCVCAGANANALAVEDTSPLHIAAQEGTLDAARALLQ